MGATEEMEAARYAGIESLVGRLVHDSAGRVDIERSNSARLLNGRSLEAFGHTDPDDVERLPDLPCPTHRPRVAVMMLAGGLNTRGGGAVGPLLVVGDETLLDWRIRRLRASPLAESPLWVFCSPFNIESVRAALAGRGHAFSGGLMPRLALEQRDPNSLARATPHSWNPAGHFDAVRWLIVHGLLDTLWAFDVLAIHSLTNIGRIYMGADALAWRAQRSDALAVVEVVRRPSSKTSGSRLVRGPADHPRLIKLHYGPGAPAGARSSVLMSSNTWWLNLATLRGLLSAADGGARDTLRAVREGRGSNAETAALADACLPAEPVLRRQTVDGVDVVQAERDLDQLSFIAPGVVPIAVPDERAVSLKTPIDLVDRTKVADLR